MTARIKVIETGPLTLVHDLGRPGLAALGVSASGAFDRGAHRLAQRLVGNDEHAAGLEVLLGGLRLSVPAGTWLALTGAWAEAHLRSAKHERAVPAHTAVLVDADAELVVGTATHGARITVALRGGIDAPLVLGSRSRDTLAGLGPAPLSSGDVLTLGPAPTNPVPVADLVPVDPPTLGLVELEVRPGPRADWFTAEAHELLVGAQWRVSARTDRTGVRLELDSDDSDGSSGGLARVPSRLGAELESEGMLRGNIQVSPDGAPTVLGPDHPVTGGYPVIAVVVDSSLDHLAQLRPGQPVRLRRATGRA